VVGDIIRQKTMFEITEALLPRYDASNNNCEKRLEAG
jgi:hypothetical protein